jgi:inorganic pyrophosphatase
MSPSLSSLGPGSNPPKIIDVLIEIPKNSKIKYEADFESGMLRVDRVLTVAVSYLCNYGFIPGTLEENSNDPIDEYVLCDALLPLSLISCSPIGVILTEDQDGKDTKIVAVPHTKVSQEFGKINNILDLTLFFRETRAFYKTSQGHGIWQVCKSSQMGRKKHCRANYIAGNREK